MQSKKPIHEMEGVTGEDDIPAMRSRTLLLRAAAAAARAALREGDVGGDVDVASTCAAKNKNHTIK